MAASLDLSDFEVLGYEVSVPMIASLVASILNTLFITLFNHIYRVVGVRLTDWENHRTDTEYENALIEKNFAFQLVNSYISFFYIAFAKPNRPNLLGVSSDDGEGTAGVSQALRTAHSKPPNPTKRPNQTASPILAPLLLPIGRGGWRHRACEAIGN